METPSLKIVLLGDSGVGKTSILSHWITGRFCDNISSTIGARHQKRFININGKELELSIWDTAGQEQYNSLMPMYTRGSDAIIIVCAIDDKKSLCNVESWIEIARTSAETPPPILLAVNKVDKIGEYAFSQGKVEIMYGRHFPGIYYISAFTGENIETLFIHAAELGSQAFIVDKTILIPNQMQIESGCC